MKLDFDRVIDRFGTNSGKWEFMSSRNPNANPTTLPFWVADMDFACPECVQKALHERVDREIFGYSSNMTGEFFRSVCGWFQHRFGWYVDSQDIFYSNGIVPALGYLVQLLTEEKDQVLIQPPIYGPFYKKVTAFNRTVVTNPLKHVDGKYEIDFQDMEEKLKDPKTTLFLLCSPHNPVGRVWSKEELSKMCSLCKAYGVKVVADEIHHDLVAPGVRHIPTELACPEYRDFIITCTSVSKTFNLAGMAYSNIIIHDPKIKEMWKQEIQGKLGVMYPNPLAITAVQAAYEGGEEWLDGVNRYIHENLVFVKRYLSEHLPLAAMEVPEGTYFAWIDIHNYIGREFVEDLETFFVKKANILIEDGTVFGKEGIGYIRMNTACPRSLLEMGMERLCLALKTEGGE